MRGRAMAGLSSAPRGRRARGGGRAIRRGGLPGRPAQPGPALEEVPHVGEAAIARPVVGIGVLHRWCLLPGTERGGRLGRRPRAALSWRCAGARATAAMSMYRGIERLSPAGWPARAPLVAPTPLGPMAPARWPQVLPAQQL